MTVSLPRISLVLLACNQQDTAHEAAASCLAQTCEPLEIVLSDDASSDATFERLQTVARDYRGPHQVRVRRNPVNQGIGAHYNALMQDTQGELIVTAAGDDVSLPHRVQRIAEAWDASGRTLDLIASDFNELSPQGQIGPRVRTTPLQSVTLQQWMQTTPFTVGATHAFTRRMFQRFGPYLPDLWYEDRINVLRALLSGGALTLDESLVMYRTAGSSHQPPGHSARQLLDWTRKQNRRVLAEVAQLTQDAQQAGVGEAVAASLERTRLRESYLRAMLEARSVRERWRHLGQSPGLPWGWRLRKLINLSFPAGPAGVRRLRDRLRDRLREHLPLRDGTRGR